MLPNQHQSKHISRWYRQTNTRLSLVVTGLDTKIIISDQRQQSFSASANIAFLALGYMFRVRCVGFADCVTLYALGGRQWVDDSALNCDWMMNKPTMYLVQKH